jgi:Transposase DDE domain group 1
MTDPMPLLPGLSPVSGKSVGAKFDGGLLSSDGGVLVLREVEQRLGVADRLAACLVDPRAPDLITHTLADIIRFRLLMIGAGYEDGNDAGALRSDPMFKMALDLAPSDRELCSQSTISRLENLPDARALLRMGRAMIDLYCSSFKQVPKRIVLDIDDTFEAVHGGQQLRLFNAHYDEYGFQPIVVFDGEGRFVAVLRPARRPHSCAASCARSAPTGPKPKSSCAATVIIARRRFSTGVGLRGWTSFSASRRHRRCAGISRALRPAQRRASRPRPKVAKPVVSKNFSTAPKAGPASSASSPASKLARKGLTRASSSPI